MREVYCRFYKLTKQKLLSKITPSSVGLLPELKYMCCILLLLGAELLVRSELAAI